jgi:phage/plasmid-associated DNA primase
MEMVLGDYKGSVPITLVTAKRNSIGSCSPEVALLQGRRYAVMQEPSVGDRINEGIMKEITGGDPIQGRALYKDTVTYVPQFSLVVCTNTLFEISSHEDGTWRRIRLVDFMSKFTEKPDPNKKYQFKIDKKIKTKFESWVPIFTSMLVNKAFETDGNVEDCDIVMNKSNQYRHDQDFVAQFCLERIIPDDEGIIKSTEVWGEFQQWYTSNYGSKDKPKAKGLYEYINKNYGEREKGRPWKGIRLLYEGDIEE